MGWFLEVGVLIIAYVLWLKLLDKRRATELLLIGSLTAMVKTVNIIVLGTLLGFVDYQVRLFPITTNIFVTSVTVSPIIVMLSEQYSSSWGGYMLRSAIGYAILNFILFPIYTLVGALQFHNWNVFYYFLVLYSWGLVVRLVFLWIEGIKKRSLSEKKANA